MSGSVRPWCVAAVGAGGGALARAVGGESSTAPFAGALVGAVLATACALATRRTARDLGDGLVHGVALALLWWFAAPIAGWSEFAERCGLEGIAQRVSPLIATIVCFGVPAGLALGLGRRSHDAPGVLRGAVVGGFAGLLGGLWFAQLTATAAPFAAQLGPARLLGPVAVGALYGVLFQGSVRGLGGSLGYGVVFGMLLWLAGPLTVAPLLGGEGVDWSATAVAAAYPAFVANVVSGLLLGLLHAVFDRLWGGLFVGSDPLRRDREGIGGRAALAVAWGAIAGLCGGLVFAPMMWDRGMLPYVAMAVGGDSIGLGLGVHLATSVAFGVLYGLLFREQVFDLRTALGSGLMFGMVLWFLGQLTLFPALLGEPFDWTLANAQAALPALIGHLIYGAATAFVFVAFELRHRRRQSVDPRWAPRLLPLAVASTAPLWLFALGLAVTLTIALG